MSDVEINQFDPSKYSKAECEFLLDQLGKPPVVAARELKYPVNPRAVTPILRRVYELIELEKHENLKWCGVDPLKDAIKTWLRENVKWRTNWERSRGRAPRWPSLYTFDQRGKAHRSGPGSDSGGLRTYFNEKGERIRFAVDLLPDLYTEWAPPAAPETNSTGLTDDESKNRLECNLCGHAESYKDGSRASKNAARARMSKHLRKPGAGNKVEEHLEVYTLEFGA